MQTVPEIILGIDPGTIVMGYGLIAVSGGKMSMIDMGVLRLAAKDDSYERLRKIHSKVSEIIAHNRPHCFAIEAPFFGKNVQSMLKLGRAQGVAIAAAMQAGLSVHEYSPRKIKQSVTGNGNADKAQVLKMLQTILKFEDVPGFMDASDALAAAVCHHFHGSVPVATGKILKGGWKSFVADNPARVR